MIGATTQDVPLTVQRLIERMSEGATRAVSRDARGQLQQVAIREVARGAVALACALVQRGLQPGEPVATVLSTHHRHLEVLLAVALAGGVAHPLNPRWTDAVLAGLLDRTGDRWVFTEAPWTERLRPLTSMGTAVLDTHDHERLRHASPHSPLPTLDERQAMVLCHTSGTTGLPKAIAHSHRAIVLQALAAGSADGFAVSGADTVLHVVPLWHAMSIGLPFAACLHGADQVFAGSDVDAHDLLDLMDTTGVTLSGGLSTGWLAVIEALEATPERWSVRPRLLCGGNALTGELAHRMLALGLRATHTWGMTETGPLATTRHATADGAPQRQGRAAPLVRVRVTDAAGRPLPWDDQATGELQIRGPWITGAYHGPDAAAQAEGFSPDGWLRTGDLARIDADGDVALVDRIKDVLRIDGAWYSSGDLEAALRARGDIAHVAVVGRADRVHGEVPVAWVVPRAGHHGSFEQAAAALPLALVPIVEFRPVLSLPRAPTGKIDKRRLRQDPLWEASVSGLPTEPPCAASPPPSSSSP